MSDYADLRLDPNVLFGEIEADSEFAPTAEEPSVWTPSCSSPRCGYSQAAS